MTTQRWKLAECIQPDVWAGARHNDLKHDFGHNITFGEFAYSHDFSITLKFLPRPIFGPTNFDIWKPKPGADYGPTSISVTT